MNFLQKTLAVLFFSFTILGVMAVYSSPAFAVCLGQCKEAKKYCSKYQDSNPGEVCGTARGYICISKDWAKIKQVNSSWIACRYKGNDAHIASAKARCTEFKEFWGGECQISSPRCKLGWIKLGNWGKISACRKIDLSGGVLYSGYRSFMRKFEGKAKHKLPKHIHPFIRKNYSFDPNVIRYGLVDDVKGAKCITDCYNIYCDEKTMIDSYKSGYGMVHLSLHELQHSEQCHKKGGRKNYAQYWFKQVPGSFFKALNPNKVLDFSDAFHDGMPMEIEAFNKETKAHSSYLSGWWHKPKRCRIYKSDSKSFVGDLDGKDYPRYYCDPQYNQPGHRDLKKLAKGLSKELGDGRYYFGFGIPEHGAGIWIGHIDIKHKVLETSVGVNFKGETCPKKPEITALIASEGIRSFKVRLNRNGVRSNWKTIKARKVGTGYLAEAIFKPNILLGPEEPQKIRLEIDGEQSKAWKTYTVNCPPLKVSRATYKYSDKGGISCPRKITTLTEFRTNGPGTIKYRRERKDGAPSEWLTATAKRVGNTYKVVLEQTQLVGKINQTRRVVAKKFRHKAGLLQSKWVKFNIDCLKILDSSIDYGGPDNGTCKFKTNLKLRINADMVGTVPYRVDCTSGQTKAGNFKVQKTGPNTFIGFSSHSLIVRKSIKEACALKVNLGKGYTNIALRGKDLTCNDVLGAAIYIKGQSKGTCPARLPVQIRVNARDVGAVDYDLKCSNGDSWSGKIKVAETAPGTFIGITTKLLDVKSSGKISCSLKSNHSGRPKIVALRGKDFQCVSRTVPTPNNDLKIDTNSSSRRKTEPIKCINGKAKRGKCICSANRKLKKNGTRSYVCRTRPSTVSCEGGKIRDRKCYCPKGHVRKKTARRTFTCIRRVN